MKSIFKFCFLSFMLLSNFIAFAQPGDDDGSGGLEDTSDPQPADINGKLILLLILGIVFAFYIIRKNLKKA
ncbi:hypothetical protein [Flavobacterium sp.]|uniref:hypothetical protein n=1 Tax=Flavobacterium sp. TaxID=239 RepID=UPI0026202194|nr:hypothetical protein [Flavobacterium sp.]